MKPEPSLAPAFQQLVIQAPIVLISLIGVLLVFSGSVSLGKAAIYARLGTIGLLLLSVVSPFIHTYLAQQLMVNPGTFAARTMVISSVFFNVLWAIFLFLLILAIITGRTVSRDSPAAD